MNPTTVSSPTIFLHNISAFLLVLYIYIYIYKKKILGLSLLLIWRMIDSLYYLSRKIPERCYKSFVNDRIHYQKHCYSLRRIWIQPLAEFKSIVKITKSNTKNITKSISIHSDFQGVHLVRAFILSFHHNRRFGTRVVTNYQKQTKTNKQTNIRTTFVNSRWYNFL